MLTFARLTEALVSSENSLHHERKAAEQHYQDNSEIAPFTTMSLVHLHLHSS